jgi:hypothetical protein
MRVVISDCNSFVLYIFLFECIVDLRIFVY